MMSNLIFLPSGVNMVPMIKRHSTLDEVRDNLVHGVGLLNERVTTAKTIASGVVTGIQGGKIYKIATESTADDALDTLTWDTSIPESYRDGAIIKIQANSTAYTVNVTKAGNILVPTQISMASTDDFVLLQYNLSTTKWELLSYRGALTGTATVPIVSGAIDIGWDPIILVDSEVADNNDDLVTITSSVGALYPGRTFRLQSTSLAEDIVILKSGNINHGETTSITLDALAEYAYCEYDGTKVQVRNHTGTGA